jgi:hypothetical protein
MKAVMVSLVFLMSSRAIAEDCTAIRDDAARLACWDNAAKPPVTPTVRDTKSWPFGVNTGTAPAPETNSSLQIREKLSAPYEDGKALSLSLTSSNGKQVLKANAAFIYQLGNNMFSEDLQRAGWSTWIGAQWAKDSSASKPVDGRVFQFAAHGTLGARKSVIALLALDAVQDNIAKALTFGFRPEFTPVFDFSDAGTPYSREGAYAAYLKLGAQADHVRLSAAQQRAEGKAAGLNVKLNLNYYPGGPIAPLRLFVDAVRARDLYAESTITKRSSTYFDFGAEWVFTRPDKKAGAIAPTLSLYRIIGSNFLIGTSPTVKTVVGFGLKIN